MSYTVGIDVGTSGTKVLVMDMAGTVVFSQTEEYPMSQPQNGWAEQEPELWWQATVKALKAAATAVNPSEIADVGLTGQMHGLVMLDESGSVLRPAILWCDQRTGDEALALEARIGKEKLLKITANPALTGFTAAKILWIQKHEPQLWQKCAHILLPKDYIRFKLTGRHFCDVSDGSGMQLMDIAGRRWSREVCDAVGVSQAQLPKLVESVEPTGVVTNEAAALTGLAPHTMVVGGAGDNAASAIGTGVVSDGKAFLTIGTSGVLFAHTSKMKLDPKGRVHTMCAAVPGQYHIMGVTQAAGLSLQWFRNQFCAGEMADAALSGVDPYSIMDAEAEEIPAGADGLIFLPYLMGERTPHLDPDCRGAFIGLSGIHTRAHLIRAVMEGVGYSLTDCLDVFTEMGAPLDEAVICGGGAKSPFWRQMLCDMYGIPLKTAANTDGAAYGAAILAAVGAGEYTSVQSAADAMVKYKKPNTPNQTIGEVYKNCHEKYKSLYVKG